MIVDISGVRVRHCGKAGCLNVAIDRHHKGSEAMWLRHFRPRSRTKHYKAFKARYEAFQVRDTDLLCRSCHDEITALNWELIGLYMRSKQLPACRTWTWAQAEVLMKFLRNRYALWKKYPRSTYPIRGFNKIPLAFV